MIQFQGSRYWVPPEYAGETLQVAADAGQTIVRAGDAIIAENRQAVKAAQCIVERDHLIEPLKVKQEQIKPPPRTRWEINFEQSVQ